MKAFYVMFVVFAVLLLGARRPVFGNLVRSLTKSRICGQIFKSLWIELISGWQIPQLLPKPYTRPNASFHLNCRI